MIWRVVLFHLRRWLTWDQQFMVWIVAFKHFAVRAGVWSSLILQNRVEPSLHRHKREKVATMTVAIAHVFAVPAQCQAHHGECHINVYGRKQILSLEGRLCRDCLFVDAINALPCCLFHRCFVFRRWYRGCNVNRIAIAISWISLGIFVFSRCGGYEKAVDFFLVPATALSSRRFILVLLQHRRHAGQKVNPADRPT